MKANLYKKENEQKILSLKTDKININLHIKDMDIDNKELIDEFMKLNLKPKLTEKKENGEVFTPKELINEMLDKLPEEVWSNKDLKWFDPAVGMGNFIIEVYWRLMEGLVEQIPDFDKRKKHIVENMLYVSELNEENIKHCDRVFSGQLNIYHGDTLKMPSDYFGVDKFDVIVGNPPYNSGGIKSPNGKNTGNDMKTVWPFFVNLSLDILKQDGHLAFITPLSWLRKSHKLHDKLLEKTIIWMKLWDATQSLHSINGGIPISTYVLNNKLSNGEKTEIVSEIKSKNLKTHSNVLLNKEKSIPLAYHFIFEKLEKFIKDNNCKIEYKRKTTKAVGKQIKLPQNYELTDMLAVDTYRVKDGIIVKKTNERHEDADKRKIIIANKASFKGSFIDDGRLGLVGNDKFYILGDNLEILLESFNFKYINVIISFTKYRQGFLDSTVFDYIPDIRKLNITDISENEFYKMVGFSQEDIVSF